MTTVEVSRSSDLGPALRAERLEQGTSQLALAEIAGVGRQWLNAFEMGDKPSAPLDMVMRVADALGVSVMLNRPVRHAPGNVPEPVDLNDLLERFRQ
ncbi:transcriptional regulator with XRE-family HTH domain [Gordonia amarae]|nr:helix-turn-helix transcriptional regulator [Gordonia amarae]MCS3880387.1 transcriptional regulator with XRE-family HTH domain [Gordonia amarae]